LRSIKTEEQLEQLLSEPSEELVDWVSRLEGDIMVIGAGGKMGPSLAGLALNAITKANVDKKVFAVSRFTSEGQMAKLSSLGIRVIQADLLRSEELEALPHAANILYMAGQKFGTLGNEANTWTVNTYLAGRIAEKFASANIVVFSSGNVYPFVDVAGGGATEETPPSPVGEYAQSRLGGERVFEYFSKKLSTRVIIIRLNYAVELRYGVLADVASQVLRGDPIDLRVGHVNVIWQRDANEIAIRSLALCSSPPTVLNVTGPEIVSVRWLAKEFGKLLDKTPVFVGEEGNKALLSNAAKVFDLFGYPRVTLMQAIRWVADWVKGGGTSFDRPTHFQETEGRF
jgi:nucleoside-diphosphate-sugar epimerase